MSPKVCGNCLMLGVFEWGSDEVMIHTSFDSLNRKRGGFLAIYAAALQAYCYFAMGCTKLITKRVFHYNDPTAASPVLTTAAKGTYMLVTASGPYGVQNTLKVDGLYYGALALTVQPWLPPMARRTTSTSRSSIHGRRRPSSTSAISPWTPPRWTTPWMSSTPRRARATSSS